MSGFDFFVDLTITGTVLGLDHTSEREAVHAVFGGGFAEPLDSFGLVEFGWHEREVVFYGAQAHRLPWLTRESGVEPALVERYGDFPDRLDVDDLLKAVAGQGFPLEEQPCHDDDHVEFRSPVSHMGVLAERSSENRSRTAPTGGAASPPPRPAGPAAASGSCSGWPSTARPSSVACTRPTWPPSSAAGAP
jgi:hypothetical protein